MWSYKDILLLAIVHDASYSILLSFYHQKLCIGICSNELSLGQMLTYFLNF